MAVRSARMWSSGKKGKKIPTDWDTVVKRWPDHEPGFRQHLDDKGISGTVRPGKWESRGRNPSRYYLEWHTNPSEHLQPTPQPPDPKNPSSIRYVMEEISCKGILVRFFRQGLRVKSWLHRLPFITFLVLMLLWTLLIILTLPTITTLGQFSGSLMALVIVWAVYRWMKEYVENQITPLPYIFQNIDTDSLLERRQDSDGDRRLYLVRYAGTCPICGGKVRAVGGGKEFHHRIVGRCDNSPREHLYSFDHVTRSGFYLR